MIDHYLLSERKNGGSPYFTDGQGAWLFTENGERYLELCDISVILGAKHPRFTEKMAGAMRGMLTARGESRARDRLAQLLMRHTNRDFACLHLTASGSEAVECAVKLALKRTGRSEVIGFWNSIHGRTKLASSISGTPRLRKEFGPASPGVVFGLYPECENCPINLREETCGFACIEFLERKIRHESSGDVGALIIEPYLGSRVVFPPPGYLKALQSWARARGIVFIMDEIQTGPGRSGSMFCYQREDIEPDMLLLGKGLGNGLHISALLLGERPPAEHTGPLAGGTGDSPLACAAAVAVLEAFEEENLLDRVRETGAYLEARLGDVQRATGAIAARRCLGLAAAVRFSDAETGERVARAMAMNRILTGGAGDGTLLLKPPLVLTPTDVDVFINVLSAELAQCAKRDG